MWRSFATFIFYALSVSSAFAESTVPSFQSVIENYHSSDAVLLDRNGKPLQSLRTDFKTRKLEWISLPQISPLLQTQLVALEDKRFYSHHGVDWKSLAGALRDRVFRQRRRGASTITMQLVGLLEPSLRRRRSIFQKLTQIQKALALEKTWTKDQILEAYLNLVPFRGELVGVSSATHGLFQKDPLSVSPEEALLLSLLVRDPSSEKEKLQDLYCKFSASCEKDFVLRLFSKKYSLDPIRNLAPQYALRLLSESKASSHSQRPLTLKTTLDLSLQKLALESAQEQIADLRRQNVGDAAVLVLENSTGAVLAYVGSSDLKKQSDGVSAKRQAGSTLKPFLYALAFEQRILEPDSILDDSPLNVFLGRGLYQPQNYEKHFLGNVSVATALASSLNIPAIRALDLVGVDKFVDKLMALGFTDLRSAEDYGLSLALGTADINLYELTHAYRALAVGSGFSARASEQVTAILADRETRALTFGLENPLSTKFPAAVKTGTSKDMRDNWCIGYTPKFTVGVWVGNFTGEPMWNVSGVTGAAPIWLDIVNYLHQSLDFQKTKDTLSAAAFEPLAKSAATTPVVETRQRSPKILYPTDGMILAFDPDIPARNQKIKMQLTGFDSNVHILLVDGEPVRGEQCPVVRGRHAVSIQSKTALGAALALSHFEVR